MVQVARDEAAAREGALERELAAMRTASETLVERERAERATILLEQAARDSARFTAVEPGRIAELAGYVVSRLIGEVSP